MDTFNKIKKKLDELKISYKVREHAPVWTSEEAAVVRGYSREEGMRRGAKAMVIRSEGKFFQFVLPGNKKLDFKEIKRILNTESASLATASEVEKVIGCAPGAVPPFGTIFGVKTFVDKSLLENDEIDLNAGKHTISITMKVSDWMNVVKPVVEVFVGKE